MTNFDNNVFYWACEWCPVRARKAATHVVWNRKGTVGWFVCSGDLETVRKALGGGTVEKLP